MPRHSLLGVKATAETEGEKGSFEDQLEKQSISIQSTLLFEFSILMKIKSRVYKLFMIINDLTKALKQGYKEATQINIRDAEGESVQLPSSSPRKPTE